MQYKMDENIDNENIDNENMNNENTEQLINLLIDVTKLKDSK